MSHLTMNYLGQHFLKNESALKKIAAALNIQKNDTIIEIGPGRGELTNELISVMRQASGVKKNGKLILIEKDPALAYSMERLGFKKNIKIIVGDALKELPKITKRLTLNAEHYKIVGNIPYYITGKLLRIMGELKNKPVAAVLSIQKEVAERICAKTPKMNLLAAAVQFWAEPKILFALKQNDFSPPPKVKSAVIKLSVKRQASSIKENRNYYKLIHIIFKQPRKTLFNNLRKGLSLPETEIKNALKSAKISPDCRPQNLSLAQIKKLLNFIPHIKLCRGFIP